MGLMYRICGLRLGLKLGVRLAAEFIFTVSGWENTCETFANRRLKWHQFNGCSYMFKSGKVLENILLCISALNRPQSVMKIFSMTFLKIWNSLSYIPHVINLKEHLLNNFEGHIHYSVKIHYLQMQNYNNKPKFRILFLVF